MPEMFAVRGIVFSHEAVRAWESKLTATLAEDLRRRRRGKVSQGWYVYETYIKVAGHWRHLYRAIDRSGALVDVMFSEHCDMTAAKAFFRLAKEVTGVTPDRVTTDGHDSYPRAIRNELGGAFGIGPMPERLAVSTAPMMSFATSSVLVSALTSPSLPVRGAYRCSKAPSSF